MFILDGFWEAVGGAIVDALRSLMLSLCEIIYKLIIFFFNIFMKLGSAEILTEPILEELYNRVGLILGLFVIFRVVFSLIQYVINPDLMVDKQKGLFNIVKRIVIVVILLGVTRPMFRFAYDAQELIINSNVIPRVITGKNMDNTDAGTDLAWYAFSSFYKYDDRYLVSTPPNLIYLNCAELNSGVIEYDFKKNNTLRYAYNCVNNKYSYVVNDGVVNSDEKATIYTIDFTGDGIVAVIVGGLILWMIVMYCIQVGIRALQLSYLQLIAPVPIIMYLDPKSDSLKKWWKQCITTYLDFFIRVAILYFTIFIIQLLIGNDKDTFIGSLGEVTESQLNWITIIIILALLIFVSKVPKLLKEVFPSLGGGAASFDFGLNPSKVFNNTLAARAIGATVGAVGAGASNAVHGFMNMKRAFKNNGGVKSLKAWTSAAGAGVKGMFSVAGGQIGGAFAGLKTKDITKSGEAIKTANKHRTDRELKKEAGYHWYNAVGDKILEYSGEPGAAEKSKNRQQAIRDEKQRQSDFEYGKRLYNTYSKTKDDGSKSLDADRAFRHSDYRDSYNALSTAKRKAKEADLALTYAQAELSAARVSNDEQRIQRAEAAYNEAYGNSKTMQGKLELAKAKHDSNKKIYADDADIENKYKYYADTMELEQPNNSGSSIPTPVSTPNVDNNDGGGELEGQVSMEELMNVNQAVDESNMNVANTIATEPGTPAVQEALKEHREIEQRRDEVEEQVQQQTAVEFVDKRRERVDYYSKMYGSYKLHHLEKMQANLENKDRTTEEEYMLEAIQNLIAKKFQ